MIGESICALGNNVYIIFIRVCDKIGIMEKYLLVYFSTIFIACHVIAQDTAFLPNYDQHCVRCLCHAATFCNLSLGCDKGYCGPFKISKIYWIDAGNVTLPSDDQERAGAFEDCAISYRCAQKIILNYLMKYGKDCNEDGVTDCDDYSMINFNGGYQCQPPLNRSEPGRKWLQRYRVCNPDVDSF